MPKYYCDYCDTYLTHDSPSVRKTHCQGRKHKDNVKFYYQKWMEEQAQQIIDATTAIYKAGKTGNNPFANQKGADLPSGKQPQIPGMPPQGMMRPPTGAAAGMPQGFGPMMGFMPPMMGPGMPMMPMPPPKDM